MKIVQIHAVYKSSPATLVVETDTGALLELSFPELKETDSVLEPEVWRQLAEEYKLFSPGPHS